MGAIIEFFRVLATLMNVVMFLSPIPSIREIHRTQSTGHMPFVPLVAMVSNAYIWTTYGYLDHNWVAIFGSCAFGVFMALIYVAVYYRWTKERAYAHKVMTVFGTIMGLLTTYIILGLHGVTGQTHNQVRLIVGYISVTSSVVMYTSPFEKLRQVLKYRSAVFIPIHIVVVGAINSATWVTFSLLTSDWMVFVPNVILLMIGLLQITMYCIFHPSTHPLPADYVDPHAKDLEASIAVTQSHRNDEKADDVEHHFVPLRSPLAPLHPIPTATNPV